MSEIANALFFLAAIEALIAAVQLTNLLWKIWIVRTREHEEAQS